VSDNPYASPATDPDTRAHPVFRWRVVAAVLLYGFGGMFVLSASWSLVVVCIALVMRRDTNPLWIIPASTAFFAVGGLWIGGGIAFQRSRAWLGTALAMSGYALGVLSGFLMQVAFRQFE